MRDQSLDARLEELAHQYRERVMLVYDYDTHRWVAYIGLAKGADYYEPHKALDRAMANADRMREVEEDARYHFEEEPK